jgi:glycosyltransferase involved in cell wall biosynthesis
VVATSPVEGDRVKVVHVTDFYLPRLGGIEMHVSDLAQRQVDRGHEVAVLTASPSAGHVDGTDDVRVVRLTDRLPPRPSVWHPAAMFVGAAALRRERPDVAHIHVGVGTPLGFWAARSAVRAGIPTLVTVHSMWSQVRYVFRMLDLPGGWSRLPIQWSAVSDAAAGPVRRMLPPEREVALLGNGIDAERWTTSRGLPAEDRVLFVSTMRLAARKRPLALLDMLQRARAQVPEAVRLELDVLGDGPLRPKVESYVAEHGMGEWVRLSGRLTRDQIHERYASADVFLAPADLESFGIAALEARCAGLPVVAKRHSGIAEFVRHGEHGLLAGSDDEMVDHLVALATDAGLRKDLSGTGGTAPSEWSNVLDRTHELYDAAGRLLGRAPVLV